MPEVPWLPAGHTITLADRGEVFYRHHVHRDPAAPTVLLLHGWTASADVQFFTAYTALAEVCSFVAIDHRGHGRGMRVRFSLEDAADDAAALVQRLGLGPVIVVGYSMGGPITLLVTQRHRQLVRGIVLQATALEWRAQRWERWRWKAVGVLGSTMRSRLYPRALRFALNKLSTEQPAMARWNDWLVGEIRRGDPHGIVDAGKALAAYDARDFAPTLRVPTEVLVTTKDRLVFPHKQRAMAAALNGRITELVGDHLCTLARPTEYAAATAAQVSRLAESSSDSVPVTRSAG